MMKIKRLTNGPKHHLFGFHDLKITNADGDKYLALEVDVMNRPPLPGELFGVGYVQQGHFVSLGQTTALNYPQGARQQWVANSNLFTVNNRVGNTWGTDLYDSKEGKLIQSYESTTHMLSADGTKSYGLDYARLFRLGGYGYSGIPDFNADNPAPQNAGITIMDMESGKSDVLVSVREVAELGTGKIGGVSHHFLTHLCLNPSSTRIAFLHRYFMADGGLMTRLMTIGVDGKGLRCLAQGFLSHFHWKDDEHIYIFGRANSSLDSLRNNPLFSNPLMVTPLKIAKKVVKTFMRRDSAKGAAVGKCFMMISDTEQPIITPFAQGIITEDGHPMTCPADSDWCVNDTYPNENGVRTLMLYNFKSNERIDLGTFRMIDDQPNMSLAKTYFAGVDKKILSSIAPEQLAFTRSGLHCDLHPRWTANGQEVIFDSIHEGTRQIYSVNVKDLLHI